jgi:uncharacterized protein (DUF305 family)
MIRVLQPVAAVLAVAARALAAPARAAALAVAIVLVAVVPASAQEQDEVLYTPEDLMFLTHMIVHHEQALELAALVPSRGQHEEFIRFARYVDGAQRAEIDRMKGLLELAAQRGLKIPEHEMHGDPPMAGMLSQAQMKAIAAASGAEFERLWLQGMIHHHQGALDMAQAQQHRQFESGRRPYGIDLLVDDIIEVQRGEITKMKNWLADWHLVP